MTIDEINRISEYFHKQKLAAPSIDFEVTFRKSINEAVSVFDFEMAFAMIDAWHRKTVVKTKKQKNFKGTNINELGE
ncbi:hypothetical protein [Oenococcus sp.]|uniref:hypothetical protein n=1 Tax=Oenococcus sp. TaxID=1979414 RepID=UPI0039EBEA4A